MKEGSHPRPDAVCPACGVVERHRMLRLFLDKYQEKILPSGTRVLYIAPMAGIRDYFKSIPGINYLGADLDSSFADVHFDLQDAPYPDGSFDFSICSHTLAHIPDDIKALSELYRLLSPGGMLLVMERLYDRPDTYQNDSVKTEEERLRHYEQEDRWRIYGKDFKERLASVGFEVEVSEFGKEISEEDALRFGIDREEVIFVCRKV